MKVVLNDFLDNFSELLSVSAYDFFGAAYQTKISRNHNRNVALAANEIASRMSLNKKRKRMLYLSAMIHDNGMVGEEFAHREGMNDISLIHYESMIKHCITGEENVRGLSFYNDIKNVVICHHENWDGSGYFSVKGDKIPLYSQIIRLADELDLSFNIMNLDDKKPEAFEFIDKFTGRIFSPQVSEAALKWLETLSGENDIEASVPEMKFDFDWERYENLADILMRIIDHKSQFTFAHSCNVAKCANALADCYGFDENRKTQLRIAAKLHDLGKIAISNSILEKPGELTGKQYKLIKEHARITREVLMKMPNFDELAIWAGQHHEKLDGSGYPDGVKGENLTMEGRMLCICDMYVAMTENRPYRDGRSVKEAMEILSEMTSEGKLDASMVGAFCNIAGDLF